MNCNIDIFQYQHSFKDKEPSTRSRRYKKSIYQQVINSGVENWSHLRPNSPSQLSYTAMMTTSFIWSVIQLDAFISQYSSSSKQGLHIDFTWIPKSTSCKSHAKLSQWWTKNNKPPKDTLTLTITAVCIMFHHQNCIYLFKRATKYNFIQDNSPTRHSEYSFTKAACRGSGNYYNVPTWEPMSAFMKCGIFCFVNGTVVLCPLMQGTNAAQPMHLQLW